MNEHEKFDWMKECERLEKINIELLEACKNVLDIINPYNHIPAQFKACNILLNAITKAKGK